MIGGDTRVVWIAEARLRHLEFPEADRDDSVKPERKVAEAAERQSPG